MYKTVEANFKVSVAYFDSLILRHVALLLHCCCSPQLAEIAKTLDDFIQELSSLPSITHNSTVSLPVFPLVYVSVSR